MKTLLKSSRLTISLACGLAAAGSWLARASAQSFPTSFQIEEHQIQKSPTVFKFQSRISQAKIPVGDAVFSQLVVNVVQGSNVLCTESFADVRVRDSVLNLEVGRAMSCLLDEVIAENNGLAFQICIGGTENCLKPIDLGSVPYAIKASFSSVAQVAHNSDIAAQAHYAHRVTADRDLLVTDQLGAGYLDFYTPPAADALYPGASFVPYQNGGFIQWAPMSEASPTLHICAKDDLNDQPMPLAELVLYSNLTTMRGDATVEGELECVGDVALTNPAGLLTVQSRAEFYGDAVFYGTVTVPGTLGTAATDVDCTGCVDGADIFDGSVASAEILDGSVTSADIHDGAIVSEDIADGGISYADIAPGAINDSHLATGSVRSDEIWDGSVTSADIALDTIAAADIAAGGVGSSEIADGSVTSTDIALDTIAAADIAAGGVGSSEIADGAVTSTDIALDTIAAADIAAGGVGSSEIADGGVGNADIAAGAVTNAKLGLSSSWHRAWVYPNDADRYTLVTVPNKIFCALNGVSSRYAPSTGTNWRECYVWQNTSTLDWEIWAWTDGSQEVVCTMRCI